MPPSFDVDQTWLLAHFLRGQQKKEQVCIVHVHVFVAIGLVALFRQSGHNQGTVRSQSGYSQAYSQAKEKPAFLHCLH